MCTPRISPYFSSATTLTKPSCWPRMVALLLARNGNFPTLTLYPSARACASVKPDAADAGLGVGAAGDAIAVDGSGRLAGNVRDRHHPFRRRDVRQLRRAGDDIADGVNAGLAGALDLDPL